MWNPLSKTTPRSANRPPRARLGLRLEPLESRLAPALSPVTIVNPTTATFPDVDGDKVVVKVSSGTLTTSLFGISRAGQLYEIDFSGGGFDGVNLTISAVKAPMGDGLVNVGYINSTGFDLGVVRVVGDLGRIDAGDGDSDTAVKSLTVRSLGRFGLDTQDSGSLRSNLQGALGALAVAGDVKEAHVQVIGGDEGKIGSIVIGGSLIGGAENDSGEIYCEGDMGTVKIGRDIQGGSGSQSGRVWSLGKVAGATIGGSIIGGSGNYSGQIRGQEGMGPVQIGQNVIGGRGIASGNVTNTSESVKLAGVSVGGSLIGGSGSTSGAITSKYDMGLIKIGHDVVGGSGLESGRILKDTPGGKLAGVTIGGMLIGGSDTRSGEVFSAGEMGMVKIGHDVVGGSGVESGRVRTMGNLTGVSLGGSLIGGSNSDSGQINSNRNLGVVKIGHDLRGGSGYYSGLIVGVATLAGARIGGSLIGGSNTVTGAILGYEAVGTTVIGHDLIGGSATGSDSLEGSGLIQSFGRISSVTIGGSVISGIDDSTGYLTRNASIRAGSDIGLLTVKGSLIGNATDNGASPVVISARGQAVPGATTDLAIGAVRIGGRVEFANILAGYNTNLDPVNGDAQIGSVLVGSDWVASNLAAGVMNAASGNAYFGDGNDALIGAGSAGITARISSIHIKGQVFGTPNATASADYFGFVAQQIGSFRARGFVAPLTGGDDLIALPLATGDVIIREIA